jgi:hypothetical protein
MTAVQAFPVPLRAWAAKRTEVRGSGWWEAGTAPSPCPLPQGEEETLA